MADKLVSEINFMSCTRWTTDQSGGFAAVDKEHIEEVSIYLGANCEANSLKIEYMGLGSGGGSYVIRGVSVIFPGSSTPVVAYFPSSARGATVSALSWATATIATHSALSAGDVVKVRTIYHGGSGLRTPYNMFIWDYFGPDKAAFADAGTTALSVIDDTVWTPPAYYTLGVDNWIGLVPNLLGTVPSANNAAYKSIYLAAHSYGNYNYDIPRADTVPTLGGDGGRYEGYTIFGRYFAKKGYCVAVDAIAGGTGDAQISDAANALRQRMFNYVKQGKTDGGTGLVHDHYWINCIRQTGQTASSAVGVSGGSTGLIGRVEHYWDTYGLETLTSTPSPLADSSDDYATVANQTEWAGNGVNGGLKVEWIDLVKWVRGVTLTQSGNLAAIGAGTMPSRAANVTHLTGYFDLLNIISPDGANYVSKFYPATQEGVRQSTVTGSDIGYTADDIHTGTGLARALQVQNPDIINYSGSTPTTITGPTSLSIEKGGSRPISLVVKDQSGVVMGAVNVTVNSSDSDVVDVASGDVTDGSGIAIFDGSNAAIVPNTATAGETATLTFTAGAITHEILVTVVDVGSLGSGGGSSLLGGFMNHVASGSEILPENQPIKWTEYAWLECATAGDLVYKDAYSPNDTKTITLALGDTLQVGVVFIDSSSTAVMKGYRRGFNI